MSRTLRILCIISLIFGAIPTSFTLAADEPVLSETLATDPAASPSPLATSQAAAATDPATSDSPSPDKPASSETLANIPTESLITPLELLKKHLFIKSVNPGYKIDGASETGEAIELANDSDTALPLDGVSLRYTNSSGSAYSIFEFPPGAQMIEKTILLRFDKTPEIKAAIEKDGDYSKIADATYSKTLALTGSLELVYLAADKNTTVVDSLCWTGKTGCFQKFNSSSPTSLVRTDDRLDAQHLPDYAPIFSAGLYLPPSPTSPENESIPEETLKPQCLDLEFSEILSYYEDTSAEQFVEIFNPTDEKISLEGCRLRYKKKLYDLTITNNSTENRSRSEIDPTSFYVYRPDKFTLTKNPNTENILELVDVTSDTVSTMKYPHGQKKGTAYAVITGVWQTTYRPTPGAPNISQEFQSCPLGKVLNEKTGNCVKATSLASVKPCPAGKYRSPETDRCRSSTDKSKAKKPCKAGYERNPETGRCRKIRSNNGADHALVPITGDPDKTSFIAFWALIGLAMVGLGYIIFQFRREIRYSLLKLLKKFRK